MDRDRAEIITKFKSGIKEGRKRLLSSKDRKVLIDGFIDKLAGLRLSAEIEEACQSEIQLLELGYDKEYIYKNLFAPYRNAIKEAHANGRLPNSNAHAHDVTFPKKGESITERQHRAFGLLKYENEFYIQQQQKSAAINNRQQDNRKPLVGETIIEKAKLCLKDSDPFIQAVAIAVLTGRREWEVLAKGKFELTDHPYALSFRGQQKAKGDPVFIIPTLIPAKDILEAFKVFKRNPQIKELKASLNDPKVKGRVGAKINNRVRTIFGEECKSGISIPIIEGRKSTTIHSLRGAYAAMACVWLKPVQQAGPRFAQAILGHCTGADMTKKMNAQATQHYDHYYVVNRKSEPLMTDDTILKEHGALPDISPEYIKPDVTTEPEKTMEQPAEPVQGTIDMSQFMDQIATMAAQKLAQPQEASGEAEQLRKQVDNLQAKNEALKAQNKALTSQLELLQTQLSQVGQILNMSAMGLGAAPQDSPTPETVEPAVEVETPAPKKPKKAEGPSDVEKRIDVLFELAQLYCQEFQPIDLSQSLIERIGVSRGNVKAWLSRNHDEVQAYRDRFGITGKRFNRNAGIDVEQFVQWIRHKEQAGKEEN